MPHSCCRFYSNYCVPFSLLTKSAFELPCDRHAIPILLKICTRYSDKVILITEQTQTTQSFLTLGRKYWGAFSFCVGNSVETVTRDRDVWSGLWRKEISCQLQLQPHGLLVLHMLDCLRGRQNITLSLAVKLDRSCKTCKILSSGRGRVLTRVQNLNQAAGGHNHKKKTVPKPIKFE